MKNAIIYTILLAAFMASPVLADREYSYSANDAFDGDQVSMIRIDMPRGEIELVRSKSNKIEIDFKNVIYARDQEEADDINKDYIYKAEITGDRLTITVDLPRHTRSRGVIGRLLSGDWDNEIDSYLRIKIPDGKNIDVKSSSADINVMGMALDLEVRSSSTDISMRDTEGNLVFDLSSGDVDISHHKGNVDVKGNSSDLDFSAVEGNLDIRTSSGDGGLDNIVGSATIYASSGDYRLRSIDGDLDIRTSSGDIYAVGISGSVRAESSSGDIRLKELTSSEGDFEIESSSGDVTLEIIDSFEGVISLKSNSGSVNSRLAGDIESLSESSIRGSVGSGKGKLRVSTTSGDIRIDRF